jgi:hypothetical protein
MSLRFKIAVLSDIHYAGPTESTAGDDYETRDIQPRWLRCALQLYREHVWLRYPLRQNPQLDRFLAGVGPVDYAIANGDYACNVAAVGLSDDGAMESAQECLGKLRAHFGGKLRVNFGDHELGKLRLLGTRGGLRLRSWQRCREELGLEPFWRLELGNYVLFNCVSTLVALPLFEADLLPAEKPAWEELRTQHFAEICAAFTALRPEQRVLFFCHDPTALPYLWRDDRVREKLPQIERTLIGHLHSPLYLRLSKLLCGLPVMHRFGHSVHRMSAALNEARFWRDFRVLLCPSLAGIDLLKDGGYYTAELDADAQTPARFQFHALPR